MGTAADRALPSPTRGPFFRSFTPPGCAYRIRGKGALADEELHHCLPAGLLQVAVVSHGADHLHQSPLHLRGQSSGIGAGRRGEAVSGGGSLPAAGPSSRLPAAATSFSAVGKVLTALTYSPSTGFGLCQQQPGTAQHSGVSCPLLTSVGLSGGDRTGAHGHATHRTRLGLAKQSLCFVSGTRPATTGAESPAAPVLLAGPRFAAANTPCWQGCPRSGMLLAQGTDRKRVPVCSPLLGGYLLGTLAELERDEQQEAAEDGQAGGGRGHGCAGPWKYPPPLSTPQKRRRSAYLIVAVLQGKFHRRKNEGLFNLHLRSWKKKKRQQTLKLGDVLELPRTELLIPNIPLPRQGRFCPLSPFPPGRAARSPSPLTLQPRWAHLLVPLIPAGERGTRGKGPMGGRRKPSWSPSAPFCPVTPMGPWPAGWQPPPWYSRALLMICLMMRSVPTRVLSLLLSSFGRRKASTRSGNEQAAGAKPTVTGACRPGDGTQPTDSGCRRRIPCVGASHPVRPHVRWGGRGPATRRRAVSKRVEFGKCRSSPPGRSPGKQPAAVPPHEHGRPAQPALHIQS